MGKTQKSQELKNRIWITEKTRIRAESRYRLYDTVAHLATVWYSVWLIVLSIFQSHLEKHVTMIGEISISLSVGLLVATLTLYGFKFGERAEDFKQCYHRLQRLKACLDSGADPYTIDQQYIEVLQQSPNHDDIDFRQLQADLAAKGSPLVSGGTPQLPTFQDELHLKFFQTMRWLIIVCVFSLPIAPLLYLFARD